MTSEKASCTPPAWPPLRTQELVAVASQLVMEGKTNKKEVRRSKNKLTVVIIILFHT
jgi:hypothetical protein